jgi:hypothetical protein
VRSPRAGSPRTTSWQRQGRCICECRSIGGKSSLYCLFLAFLLLLGEVGAVVVGPTSFLARVRASNTRAPILPHAYSSTRQPLNRHFTSPLPPPSASS